MPAKPKAKPPDVSMFTVERLLVHPQIFGLQTATPAQRSICRAIDGLPQLEFWDDPNIRAMYDGVKPLENRKPDEVLILAAIRCAKSLIAATTAVRAALTVDISGLGPGEVPRIPVLATDKDTAAVVFNHLVGNVLNSPFLSGIVVGDPTADSVELRHPSGRKIEIKVTALSRAGSTLVGRWLAGVVFDEAPRMGGDSDTVLSLDQARYAVRGRLLKGAQILYIGSPWAPLGPIYDMAGKYWGKPESGILVVRAPGWILNPFYWTPAKCELEKETDPTAYLMNVAAEFGDPEQSLISSAAIENCRRKEPDIRKPEQNLSYVAAMDPATRGNAWTLVIIGCSGFNSAGTRKRYFVALNQQWKGNPKNPLSPDAVLKEISTICLSYGLTSAITDQYSADALTDLAIRHGLRLYPETLSGPHRLELFERLRLEILEGNIELSPDQLLYRDLICVKKKLTTNGYSISLPSTGDGRHADYAAAMCLAMADLPIAPAEKPKPVDEDLQRAIKAITPGNADQIWDNISDRLAGSYEY